MRNSPASASGLTPNSPSTSARERDAAAIGKVALRLAPGDGVEIVMVPTLPGQMPMNMESSNCALEEPEASSGRPACQKPSAVCRLAHDDVVERPWVGHPVGVREQHVKATRPARRGRAPEQVRDLRSTQRVICQASRGVGTPESIV